MMNMKLFSGRETPMQQICRRLPAIESTYGSLLDADAAETHERLLRMRYGPSARSRRRDR